MRLLIHTMWCSLFVVGVLLLSACQPTHHAQEYQIEGKTMGTYYIVKFYAEQQPELTALQHLLDTELELINDLMSTYRPESELMRFNRQLTTESFQLSPQTASVIAEALRIGEQSGGILDVTVGPLVELWGFGAQGRITHAPESSALVAIRDYVGIDKLTLNENVLRKHEPRVAVDLSTIAKGYGVDRLAEILLAEGYTQFMVDIGGDMRVGGEKPTGPWKIAVEKPVSQARAVQRILAVENMSLATSGDYRNYFEENGIRYSHLIDPRTGMPIQHRTVSSTVLHPAAMTADAYATTLNVLPVDEALAFANTHQIAVLLIVKTDQGFEERYSDAFRPYLLEQ
ncbi:FAD:protein FMN transferase [Alishewanella tabrizica]|uniref:FAD:protein FMN transferase n=1 Tax=Alishewanella tabrizica TaxID=671278 RepID=A0ABQ2WRH4_9ALTE|nr:FAD:protein FMN transferase [Alishewanella tabrizica]GGW65049.1 FAD:protein FMN transferase [Alishewanella tabrizica]